MEEKEPQESTRREFIKKIGLGTLTAGGIAFLPSALSKLTITDTGITRDGTSFLSSTKVNLSNALDFNQNEAKEMVVENRTSDPSSPAEGQLWVRTDL